MHHTPLWQPSLERIETAHLTTFLRHTGFSNYESLHRWSIDQPGAFWKEFWNFASVIGEAGNVAFEEGREPWSSSFFPHARLNVAENLLRTTGFNPAIISIDEDEVRRELSWDQLRADVLSAAAALQALGVQPGDRVAAWLPLIPEAVILLLAATAIGAVYSSTSPDFGAGGVLDRFGQIEPKVLVATSGYQYNGKWFDCAERLREIRSGLPSLQQVVMVEQGARKHPALADTVSWQDWLRSAEPLQQLERFPFDQPWLILFSSGTTGRPKCIVHRAGGVFLNLLKEHVLQCDVRPGDRLMYFTTIGWMMYNWLVNGLAAGASLVLVDGSPFYPETTRLLDIVDRENVTLFGISAKYIDALRKTTLSRRFSDALRHLRTICSTGSPLSPESFEWIYSKLKHDVHLASISGGTDICGCFLSGSPIEPVYAGELQRPGLGMAIDVWDEDGHSLRNMPGVCGELVCTRPFPSQPLAFWGDTHGQSYRRAYFEKYPGVWAHGDFASWTPHGGMIIYGRSDATLNPGGVRIGTAEIYRVVEQMPGIIESLVFGQSREDDVRIVLLLRLAPGSSLTQELKNSIRQKIKLTYTPRHVPAVIAAVDDLPRTRNNKLVELAVSDLVNGRAIRNIDAIANPDALFAIGRLPDLQN